ncbi:unnamed protein product [Diatraea saccharalis]|uniref:Uncharacterized protein n=1 Tax=Diatraea saccharalis TaxID=40085 RepID=A0A9N9WKK7_9NEOP|nr:unnamed protein product [Diatraea saccharalis]
MEYTDEPLEGLKNKKIDKSVWLKLEQDFEKQQEYLQHFWNTTLHCQLFIKCHFTLRKLRRCVFKVLRSSSFKVWPDIRWKEVVSKFPDGFTHKFLYWTTIRVFKKFKTYSKTPLQELVDYGLDITRSKYPRRNCKLRTLTLNEYGHLEEIYYKDKLKISFF